MTQRLPDTLTLISQLIQRPSISSTLAEHDQGNLSVIHCLAEWLETLGFRIDIRPLSAGKANLIATLGPADAPGGLVLSGHTDTVPCNPERWHSDPFRATLRDNRIYGLGSADMKSFFALVIEAVSRFDAKHWQAPLVVLATADEESTMQGARSLLQQNLRCGRYALIGEPTGLKPVRLHKGIMMRAIEVLGQAGHSSNPALGANAIEGMQVILTQLLDYRDHLKRHRVDPAFAVDHPTLNLGSIQGGDNPNRICGHCEARFDVRPLPGMSLADIDQELLQRLQTALDRNGNPGLSLRYRSLFEGVPAFETPVDSLIVQVAEAFTGERAIAVDFATEAPFLAQLGMETLVMGPGYIEQAHQPDEYLPLAHIEPAINLLARFVERFCAKTLNAP